MARLRRITAVALGVLMLLLGSAALTLRAMRGRHGSVESVPGVSDVYRVRNLMVDLYGARADDGVVLFDAGLDAGGAPINALLIAMKARRADVRALFLTHGHPDHVAAAPAFATVFAGAGDAALLRREGGKGIGIAKVTAALFAIPLVTATESLSDRRDIPVGRQTLTTLPFAGHTQGSFLYFFRGVLFVGDAFNFEKGALALPPDRFTEDPEGARRAIAGLPALLTGIEVKTICTGHGGCTPPARTQALLDDLVRRVGGPSAP